nr:hypothetical protein [Tanacetum cinerariifolium]
MTDAQLKALIDQGVDDALAARDTDRSRNGKDNLDSETGVRRQDPLAHECTYPDFMKSKPLYFKGTEGITVGHDVAYAMTWTNLKKKMIDKYCPRGEIKKLEFEMWNMKVKVTDVVSYNQRFQELALMCATVFPEESDKIERAYTTGSGEKKPYKGSKPLCSKCNYHHDELGSFDVIIGMDWLAKYQAIIVCAEKIVRIPWGNETLIIRGDRSDRGNKTHLNIISCTKTQKYMRRGCHIFLAHVTTKKAADKSEEKRFKDVPIIQDFLEVFPEDLSTPGAIRQRSYKAQFLTLGSSGLVSQEEGWIISNVNRLPRTEQADVMLFGLTNASTVFMNLMNRVCKPYLDKFAIVFIDDILIYSSNKKEHEEHLKAILELLKKEGLYVKFFKYEFWIPKVQFLSHVIDSQETDENTTNPQQVPLTPQASYTLSTIKLLILKKDGLHKGYDREGFTSYTDDFMYSFFANQSSGPKLDHEDLEQVDEFNLEEIDLKWQVAMIYTRLKKFYKKIGRKLHFDAKEPIGFDKNKVDCFNCHNTRHFARECRLKGNQDSRRRDEGNIGYKERDNEKRPAKQDQHKAMVTIDGEGVDWTGHAEDDTEDYALMAFDSSNLGADTEVTSCSKVRGESYAKLKKLYNEQREQLGVASIEIQAYTCSDVKDSPVNDRFAKVEGMHAVSPPMTDNYMPPKSDFGIDESKFTYDPKQSTTSEFDAKTSDLDSCDSSSSEETW